MMAAPPRSTFKMVAALVVLLLAIAAHHVVAQNPGTPNTKPGTTTPATPATPSVQCSLTIEFDNT